MFAFSDSEWPGIAKLNEECGELVQVMGKLMMIHGTTAHWSGDLRKMLVDEMADVEAALTFVKENCLTKKEVAAIRRRVASKLKRFEKWHRGNEVKRRIAKNVPKAKTRTSNAVRRIA